MPTAGHKAIAQMVAKGYFRVIITTNFDRLMEQALEAESISPTVISTSDMVRGAVPLAHSGCTLIKVHGDYRDTRLRNTSEELSAYDADLDKLLDQVFDEYGLIVCGWSATWDKALRNAILRSPNRRYSVSWALKGTLSAEAETVAQFRQASLLPIESADKFFTTLADKLVALERFDAPHPLSKALAVASLKRFLVEDRFRIELNDLLSEETSRQVAFLAALEIRDYPHECSSFMDRANLYETSMEMLIALVSNGCYWGEATQASIWGRAILRTLDLGRPQTGNSAILALCRYPACLLLYASGIASIASGKCGTLKALVKDLRTSVDIPVEGKDDLAIRKIAALKVLDGAVLNRCRGESNKVPASDRIYSLLREPLRAFLPDDNQYDDAFDRFEYLLALVYFDAQLKDDGNRWAPIGRFSWRNRFSGTAHVSGILMQELKTKGGAWEPLASGLFADAERYLLVDKEFREGVLARVSAY
jgi:SIR2-like domain